MTDKPIYAVMRRSGRMMQFRTGLGGSGTESSGPYLSILDTVATEFQSAGSDWDAPAKLFLNGRLVVDGGLSDLAWKYRQDDIGVREYAQRAIKNLHTPDWVPIAESKPGYNPLGIDKWTVRKEK